MFSKTCEYGLKAVVFVALGSSDEHKIGIKEIAEEIESPMFFTGKILQTLVKAGVLQSTKGPNGGFFLSSQSKPVPVIRVLEALECDGFFHRCALGLKHCSDKRPCPMHEQFKFYREGLRALLSETTVQHLAAEIRAGNGHITDSPLEGLVRKGKRAAGSTAR